MGKKFSVEVPVKRVDGARLLLFSQYAARQLRLQLPSSPAELETAILSRFALMLDESGRSTRSMIATRYLDADSKGEGQPMGDGRVVWSGQIEWVDRDGHAIWLDVTLKGIGRTPLAWSNHPDELHKDGLLPEDEAILSYVQSEIAARNGIDSTLDLAVIELPIELPIERPSASADRAVHKAAISVRVGRQLRVAHFRYQADDPEAFRKIFEYAVRRELGMPADARIEGAVVERYLRSFASVLTEEAARYYDLHAVHGSPTVGNRTAHGGSIDFGTFTLLDAHHAHFRYFGDGLKLGGKFGQTEQFKAYLEYLFEYLVKARYSVPGLRDLSTIKSELSRAFDAGFEDEVARLGLARLGLDDQEIAALPEAARKSFYGAIRRINGMNGSFPVKAFRSKVMPAAFEIRKILRGTAETMALPANLQRAALEALFATERSWKTKLAPSRVGAVVDGFEAALREITGALKPSPATLRAWSQRAGRATTERDGTMVSLQGRFAQIDSLDDAARLGSDPGRPAGRGGPDRDASDGSATAHSAPGLGLARPLSFAAAAVRSDEALRGVALNARRPRKGPLDLRLVACQKIVYLWISRRQPSKSSSET